MESLLQALFLAAITGITIVAYKHPQGYGRLYPFIAGLLLLIMISMVSWEIGNNNIYSKLYSLIPAGKRQEADAMLESAKIPNWYSIPMITALFFYFALLQFLPYIIKKEPENRERNNKSS